MQVLVKEPELRQVGEAIVQRYYMAVEGVKAVKGHQARTQQFVYRTPEK